MTTNQQTVTLDEAKEQVRRTSVRLGLLHISFARTLVNELGEERGKELILKAIRDYGTRIGLKSKTEVTAEGLENTPVNFQEDLPSYGMYDSREVVELGGETRTCVYGCVMGKLWNELEESKLGRLYCYVDLVKYMTYNPNFKLVHIRALPDGDECCELVVRSTTKQDRRDFNNNDNNWSRID